MAEKLLISISAREVSAARWRGGRFTHASRFTYDEAGVAEFKNYLRRSGRLPVHMVIDAVEEDYRVESLPHSFGGERNEMLNRKLRQYYRNTPYFSARLQGRDTGKRRDDQYLFCALTNPDLVSAWVQALIECGMPMAGIYLRPTLSSGMLERLQVKSATVLLVSIDSSGMRLTFLRDQKLRVSRLAQIESGGATAIRSYAEEVSNTRLYLHALRILTLDEPLSVLVVDTNDSQTELVRIIASENPNLECQRIGRQEIISRLDIPASALDSSGDALSLHLLGLRAPENNLAPADVTVGYRRHQTRRGLYALTAVSALTTVLWCGFNWVEILGIKSETAILARQTSQTLSQYQQATRQFPAAPTSAENLRRAVEIAQRIGSTTRSPEAMMSMVSQVLDAHPAISLNNLGWKYGRTDIEADRGRALKSALETVNPGAAGSVRKQSGLIDGEVRPFLGDYRQAIETIDRFADALSKRPEVAEVRVVKMPLNISPELALSGNTSESREQAGRAEFKLLLVMKPTS